MRNLLLILIFLFAFSKVFAQTNYYMLKVQSNSYSDLTGDIPLAIKFASGDAFELKELYGETFKLFGKSLTMDTLTKGILIFPNAFVEVVDNNDIMVFDGLIRELDSIDNTSKISYKIEGSSGKKIIKVQWKNLRVHSGLASNYVNLQIWIYQENDIVEYRYGPSSVDNASGYTQATGPSVGIFYSTSTVSTMYQKIWISGTPPSIIVDTLKNTNLPNIFGVPANGTVYQFIPKTVAASVKEISTADKFSIYPNPANDKIIIASIGHLNSNVAISLHTVTGQLIKRYDYKHGQKELTIPVSSLANGNYIISIESSGNHQQKQIIVQH
ncbi:MAG: T9SS type A sorting domain-containing protein [Bacteroidetes bacterium]|nr:T9SS type A sorting domain-containing protein [Bacteroidota bacterium]